MASGRIVLLRRSARFALELLVTVGAGLLAAYWVISLRW